MALIGGFTFLDIWRLIGDITVSVVSQISCPECNYCHIFGDLLWRKAMAAYAKPQKMKKGKSERLRGEGDQIKFIDLGFERVQAVGFRKGRRKRNAKRRGRSDQVY